LGLFPQSDDFPDHHSGHLGALFSGNKDFAHPGPKNAAGKQLMEF
jgi:hypothetical protein